MIQAMVIGSNGYLGRHICLFLEQMNVSFLAVGKAKSSIDNYSNYKSIDVTKNDALATLDFNVDFVFMFAGMTGSVNDSKSEKEFTKVNEQGLKNVLDSCISCSKKPKVIFPSTRLVYKGQKNAFLLEDSEKEAKTVYAQNKLNCESLLANYQQKHNLNYTIFRICVPYGNLIDDSYSYGTVGFFLSKAKSKNNISLYGDGELKRTFTHISDLTNIIISVGISVKSNNQTYNIGSNDNLSLRVVAQLIADKCDVGIEFVKWPKLALQIESGDTIFSDEKLKKEFDIEYQHLIKKYFNSF